ncbi:MAG: type II toxin-antitoxin system RelE family toxin [Terriglobia bacterium]
MSWVINLSRDAEKQLRRLPAERREQIHRALDEMTEDPVRGDVIPIKSGKFKGALRKRVGRYRVIFVLEPARRVVAVGGILLRSEKTYR